MTLTELLIASALVGIVTLGLVAAEQAVRTSRVSSSSDSQLSAKLQATMIQLSRDASQTVGDANDTGIWQFSSANDNTVCFRQAAGDPNSYSDDPWFCWWADKLTGNLWSCGNLLDQHTSCQGLPANQKHLWGTLSDTNFYSLVNNSQGQIDHIQLNLVSRYDTTKAVHPITNPDYTLSAEINPPGLSR